MSCMSVLGNVMILLELLVGTTLFVVVAFNFSSKGMLFYLILALSLILRSLMMIGPYKFHRSRETLLGLSIIIVEVGSVSLVLIFPPNLRSEVWNLITILCLSIVWIIAGSFLLCEILIVCGSLYMICGLFCKRSKPYSKKEILELYQKFKCIELPQRRPKIIEFLMKRESLLISEPLLPEEVTLIQALLECPLSPLSPDSECSICREAITYRGAGCSYMECGKKYCQNKYHTVCLIGQWLADRSPGLCYPVCFHSLRTDLILALADAQQPLD